MSDPRTGPVESNSITLAAGDADAPQTLIEIPEGALFRLEQLRIEYDSAATANIDLAVFDDADGTAAADVGDQRDMIREVAPGDREDLEYTAMRDFEEDVLIQEPNAAQDGDATITAQGHLLTALSDVMK